MWYILSQRTMLPVSMFVLLTAVGAAAQDPQRPTADQEVVSLRRLSANAFSPERAPIRVALEDDEDCRRRARHREKDEEDTHRWDAIKRGFFTGLALGGLVGVALASECGHPECGPVVPLAAGIGASIGMGIDALVDRRPTVAGVSAHDGAGRGRRLSIAVRKSW